MFRSLQNNRTNRALTTGQGVIKFPLIKGCVVKKFGSTEKLRQESD